MSTAIIGSCGEHYVAAYLAGYGLVVALPRAGIRGSDLFVGHADGGRLLRVQVKTGTDSFGPSTKNEEAFYSWHTDVSVIKRHDENLWYAYIWLCGWPQKTKLPEVFFIPSEVVVERMKALHPDPAKPAKISFFWMHAKDLDQWKGEIGLQELQAKLTPITTAASPDAAPQLD